ncbi:MAG TPA: hypothetical protein VGV37_21035 [Aliidongia sp.]|uniref:DUF7689 domain-containing protein n=1 Tax=Aliidongia sp. TaxID=1914230 RepID=UPI002DDD2F98|nr:hypothetical protein [Aliidongia sp.]HEV2677027.1 hypothetical protein [Aliidongia sp.]
MPKKKKSTKAEPHQFMPRLLTDTEWESYHEDFPDLVRTNAYVTDPGVYDGYNCIGWSVGDTGLEFDVEAVTGMVEFYKGKGFEEVEAKSAGAEIDLFGVRPNGYFASHASKKYTGPRVDGMPDGLWESKLYPGVRMSHGRLELQGEAYGDIVKSFRKSAVAEDD